MCEARVLASPRRVLVRYAKRSGEAARSRARSPCRTPQMAKFVSAFLFCSFFFAPALSKKKRVEVLARLLKATARTPAKPRPRRMIIALPRRLIFSPFSASLSVKKHYLFYISYNSGRFFPRQKRLFYFSVPFRK